MARARPAPRGAAELAEDTSFSAGLCVWDGTETTPDGWCAGGQGYAVLVRMGDRVSELPCAFACPHCGGTLAWSGWCRSCSDRTRAFPGDEYRDWRGSVEVGTEATGHWRQVGGPQPFADAETVAAGVTALTALVRAMATRQVRSRGADPTQTGRVRAGVA